MNGKMRYVSIIGNLKTKNRSHVAKLNSAVRETDIPGHRRDRIGRINEELSMKVNRFLVSNGSRDYIYPHEKMYQELRATYGENLFNTRAAKINMKLSDFIPDEKQLIYHYDFGDSWQHKIEVLRGYGWSMVRIGTILSV